MCDKCIQWDADEKQLVERRILNLADKQIVGLFERVGIKYDAPMEEIITEIRESEWSFPLDVLTTEASSKEDLLKWLKFYEQNRN